MRGAQGNTVPPPKVALVMANDITRQSTSLSAGPKLLGAAVALFVLTRIITWLPLGWIDGPLLGLLWLGIIGCVLVGGGLTVMRARKS